MRTSVTRIFRFEAAHYLPRYSGACARLHGHSYKLEVTVSAPMEFDVTLNAIDNMVIDFSQLSTLVKTLIVDVYDHQNLNDFFGMPTVECMCSYFFRILDTNFNIDFGGSLILESVKLWETENSYAEVKRE